MQKKMIIVCSILLLLLSFLSSCSSVPQDGTKKLDSSQGCLSASQSSSAVSITSTITTTIITPASTSSSTSTTTTVSTSTTATQTTATSTTTANNVLRKKWSGVSNEVKLLLEQSGVSYENIVVDKSNLKYDEQRSNSDIHPKYSTYSTDNAWYSFNDLDGKLTFASLPKDLDFTHEKTEKEIRKIAETFAGLFIDTAEYTIVDVIYDETLRNYSIDYYKSISGYRTFSGVGVTVFVNGKIGSYSLTKIGLFDNVTVPTIDKTAIIAECEKMLNTQYDDLDKVEIDFSKSKIDIKDGQLLAYYKKQPEIEYGEWVMICYCTLHFKGKQYSSQEYIVVPLG